MFTSAFIQQVILPNTENQPAWIAASIEWAGRIAGAHIFVWKVLFAGIQVILGLALIFNFRARVALAASFLWSAIVWWAGEGFGGLITGSALVPTGAPGAIVLYVLAGIALWPARDNGPNMREDGTRFAPWSLRVLWLVGATLRLQSAFLAPHGLDQVFTADWLARLARGHSIGVTIFLSVIQFAVGLAFLGKKTRPAGRLGDHCALAPVLVGGTGFRTDAYAARHRSQRRPSVCASDALRGTGPSIAKEPIGMSVGSFVIQSWRVAGRAETGGRPPIY